MAVTVQNPINSYLGNGSAKEFTFSFRVLDEGDLKVFIEGVQQSASFAIVGVGNDMGGSVVFVTAPATGERITLQRLVSLDRETAYQDGAALQTETLNRDFDRVVQMVQDSRAAAPLALDGLGQLDATGKRITNVADPIDAQDVVTKVWAETSGTAQVAQATAQAVIATSKAAEAYASAAAAASSEADAHAAAVTAATSEVNSNASKVAAAISETNAAGSATAAAASAATAGTGATTATTKAGEAATSAANASTSESNANASKVAAGISETNAAGSATAAAASAASIAGGPVASIMSRTGIVTTAQVRNDLGLPVGAPSVIGNSILAAADAPTVRILTGTLDGAYNYSFRNIIRNGDMFHNQRAQVASTTAGTYPVDGWRLQSSGVRLSIVQGYNVNTTPALNGNPHFLQATVVSAGAMSVGDFYALDQAIEGTNIRHLQWGSPNAAPVVMSFDFSSTVNGIYSVSVRNYAFNRSYVTTINYTGSGAGQHFTKVIPGDTTGGLTAYPISAAGSLYVSLALGMGTTRQTATLDAWQAGNLFASTMSVNLCATNGAVAKLTNVQIERGAVATPFENLDVEVSRRIQQRHYYSSYEGVPVGTAGIADASLFYAVDLNNAIAMDAFPTRMRAAPNCVLYNPATGAASNVRSLSSGANIALSAGLTANANRPWIFGASGSLTGGQYYHAHLVASAELV